MTQQMKQELKKEGFTVIQTSYWVVGILVIIIGLGVNFGMSMKRIDTLESKVQDIEIWKENHIDWSGTASKAYQRQLHEIQLNLKVLMEKQGLKYQSITE